MEKIVFLDRDGVIIKEKNLISKVSEVELLPNSAEAIKLLNESGYKVIVVTSQPIVARGLSTVENVENMNKYMEKLIVETSGAHVDKIYFCPHHPTKGIVPEYSIECDCRKPKPGMLLQAKKDFGLVNLNDAWMVGDTIGDSKTGDNVGCKTILVSTGHSGNDGFDDSVPMYKAKDLYDAVVNVILKEDK